MKSLTWGGSASDDVRHIVAPDSYIPHGNTNDLLCGERWSLAWMSTGGSRSTSDELEDPNACPECVAAHAR